MPLDWTHPHTRDAYVPYKPNFEDDNEDGDKWYDHDDNDDGYDDDGDDNENDDDFIIYIISEKNISDGNQALNLCKSTFYSVTAPDDFKM